MIRSCPTERPTPTRQSLRGIRRERCAGRGRGWLVVLVLAALLVPVSAAAQVGEAETRYREALEAYGAVAAQRDQVLQQHEILVDRQIDARESGDEERARNAMAQVHFQGTQLTYMDRQVQAAAAPVREAAEELLRALDAREEELLDRLEGTLPEATRDRLNAELVQLRMRSREVEAEAGSDLVTRARLLPDLAIGPRDGPRELRAKAGLMESLAEQYDTVLVTVEREIEVRERWIQQERGREDLMAGISRFGDDRLVGGGLSGPAPENGDPDDGGDAELDLAELPLPDQVTWLREYGEWIADQRDEALVQARVFRDRAEGRPR